MSNSLQAVLNKSNKSEPTQEITAAIDKKVSNKKYKSEIDREKKVLIGGHFLKQVSKQLRFLAIEEDKTNQQLLSEALDLLFVKKGKSKIKDL